MCFLIKFTKHLIYKLLHDAIYYVISPTITIDLQNTCSRLNSKYSIALTFFEYQDLQRTQMLLRFKSDSMPKIQFYTHMLDRIKHM